MNIAALAATALLATAPISVAATETNNDGLTVEYAPLDQVPDRYTTVPYMQTGVCMITEQDVTCATDTQWKRVTLHDRYTQALYKFIRKEPTMSQLATITDVYDEIRNALSEHADDFNIEGIANDAYIFNPTTQTFEPSPTTTFWAAVEANANANTQGN
jgi:hypothetical protein|nr:MAG TPA: hypothetical protein [Caudoviricetes sp.]